jgi:hypothetical protein
MRAIDLTPLAGYTMCRGIGNLENKQACVLAQAAILDALNKGHRIAELTDELDCACPILRILLIALNDINWWENDQERSDILSPLISLILDSRVSLGAQVKRAQLSAEFAKYAAEYAVEYAAEYATSAAKFAAKSAKSAESAEYAKYATSAVKFAAKSAKSAKYAEYAARFAAKSAESVKSAEYAAWCAEYAEAAADSTSYTTEYTESDARYAESAKSAIHAALRPLRDKLMRTWMACEAIKDVQ